MHNFLKEVMQMIFENAEVYVIRSGRKTVSIQVKPNEVIIRAPMRMKEKEIEKFVESKRNWIEKHLKTLSEKRGLSSFNKGMTLWRSLLRAYSSVRFEESVT